MANSECYWDSWARYWEHVEDFFLDKDVIDSLAPSLQSSVLIVGAGQGMLVERLRRCGLEVDGVDLSEHMVEFAKRRRGIDLVRADAASMPFRDGIYKTTVVATGVIDFAADERTIRAIIREALRVTHKSGRVLVAFCQFNPRIEVLFRQSGLITGDGQLHYRRFHQMTKLSCEAPIAYFHEFRQAAGLSRSRALITLAGALLLASRKERRARRGIGRLWRRAQAELVHPDALFECAPESIPYRDEESIRRLFKRLELPLENTVHYDSCVVARLR